MHVARKETLVQLTDELVGRLDSVAARQGRSRSQLIREVLTEYVLREDYDEKVRRDVEGYTRCPPDDEFDALAEWNARRMVLEEPWE